MNSPSDDDMFSRYRTELVMDAEARARTFCKLQERVLRGEQPLPEIDVLPPQTAALRGLWSLPAKWVVTIAGLGVGALLVANVVLRGVPLTAADEERVLVAPPSAAGERDRLPSSSALAHEVRTGTTPGPVARAENGGHEATPRAQARSAARAPRANTELTKRTANVAPAPGAQLTAAMRSREAGSPLSDASRAQSQLAALARPQESVSPAGASEVGQQPPAVDPASQAAVTGAAENRESVASSQPSAAAANAELQKQAYVSPKVPQRSDKEVASETLTKEVQLLQAAQLALRAGDTQRSLALLAEHTWTYPQGHLAEARDVARILALCQAGNVAQSKLHAKRFLQQRPESPYALRVRAGCAAMTDSSAP